MLIFSGLLSAQPNKEADVRSIITSLGYSSSDKQMKEIAAHGIPAVVPLLLKELRVVAVPVVYEDEKELKDLPSFTSIKINNCGIHVLMCIKTLEYISSVEFSASSKSDFSVGFKEDPDLEDRIGLIQINSVSKHIFKSYYHWESHLKYFLPPPEAQKKIIAKWHSWWKKQNSKSP